jgi:hypothetical protein
VCSSIPTRRSSDSLLGAVIGLLQALTLWVLAQVHKQTKRAPRRRTDPPGFPATVIRRKDPPSNG